MLRSQDPLHRQLQVHRMQEPGGRPRQPRPGHQEGGRRDVDNVDNDVIVDSDVINHVGGDDCGTNPESSKPQGEVGALYREWGVQAARGCQVSTFSLLLKERLTCRTIDLFTGH